MLLLLLWDNLVVVVVVVLLLLLWDDLVLLLLLLLLWDNLVLLHGGRNRKVPGTTVLNPNAPSVDKSAWDFFGIRKACLIPNARASISVIPPL